MEFCGQWRPPAREPRPFRHPQPAHSKHHNKLPQKDLRRDSQEHSGDFAVRRGAAVVKWRIASVAASLTRPAARTGSRKPPDSRLARPRIGPSFFIREFNDLILTDPDQSTSRCVARHAQVVALTILLRHFFLVLYSESSAVSSRIIRQGRSE